jgi:hypothetical protein
VARVTGRPARDFRTLGDRGVQCWSVTAALIYWRMVVRQFTSARLAAEECVYEFRLGGIVHGDGQLMLPMMVV